MNGPPAPSTRNLRIVQAMTIVIILAALAGTLWLQDHHELLVRIGRSPFALPALFLVIVISSATLFLPVPGLAITTLVGSLLNPWARSSRMSALRTRARSASSGWREFLEVDGL